MSIVQPFPEGDDHDKQKNILFYLKKDATTMKYKKECLSIIDTLNSYGAVIYKHPALIREQLWAKGEAKHMNQCPVQLIITETAMKQPFLVTMLVSGAANS